MDSLDHRSEGSALDTWIYACSLVPLALLQDTGPTAGWLDTGFTKTLYRLVCPRGVESLQKNVLANCRSHFETAADFDQWMRDCWYPLVNAGTPTDADNIWGDLTAKTPARVVRYLADTWMPVKEMFMTAWICDTLHLGNLDSSRCEGMHNALKKYLMASTGDLLQVIHFYFYNSITLTTTFE